MIKTILRSLLVSGVALALAAVASAETVTVSPGDMGTWSFFNTDDNGAACLAGPTCAAGSMVTGPATPVLGQGSANLQTAPGNGDGAALINTTALNGTSLGSLVALSYSTYSAANNGQQFPYLKLSVTWAGQHPGADQFFFEPPYQTPSTGNPSLPDQGATVMNTWQTWDAFNGAWWDNGGVCNPGNGPGTVCSLSDLIAGLHLTAGVTADDLTIVGLSLRAGYADPGDNFNGNVDNVTIGTTSGSTTYDFEATAPTAATPEPGTFVLLGTAGLMLLAVKFRSRKPAAI